MSVEMDLETSSSSSEEEVEEVVSGGEFPGFTVTDDALVL